MPTKADRSVVRLWEDKDPWGPYVLNAIKAKYLFKRDHDYIVTAAKEIKIVNTVTGRILPISRWSDNIHQVGCLLSAFPICGNSRFSILCTLNATYLALHVCCFCSG